MRLGQFQIKNWPRMLRQPLSFKRDQRAALFHGCCCIISTSLMPASVQ